MPGLQRFDETSAARDILLALDQDGGCIFEDLISAELCDRMVAEFRPHVETAPWGNREPDNLGESEEFFGSAHDGDRLGKPWNGATVVAPGSHRWPDGRQPTDAELCLATMPRGAALLYSGAVLHGGGSNREQEIRTGLYLGYIPSWLAELENHGLSNAAGVIESLDEPVKRLLNVSRPFATFP